MGSDQTRVGLPDRIGWKAKGDRYVEVAALQGAARGGMDGNGVKYEESQ